MIILDEKSSDSLYIQLYKQIKNEIISGEMHHGSKLHSIRNLSNTLNVSKNTVKYAYEQLASEGYIISKIRDGFYVQDLESDLLKSTKKQNYVYNTTNNTSYTYKYNFQYGKLCPDDFPINTWRKISNQLLTDMSIENMTSYNERKGELKLKLEIMKYISKSRGVTCDPAQIIICSGTQTSYSLLCQLFRTHSKKIAIEDPGYDGARDVFINNDMNVIPVSLESDGVNIYELIKTDAKIIYTTPSHQFPTGVIMPIKKRLQLLEWATKNDAYIIEDDYDSEFRYSGKPIPSMQSIDSNGRVVYLGTFSKSLSPALRISYIVLPEKITKVYADSFGSYASSAPWLEQKILENFINLGYLERHLRKVSLSYKRKHDTLVHAIEEVFREKVVIHGTNAGLHILLEFINSFKEDEIIELAKNNDILVYPVSKYWINKKNYNNNMILLGFSNLSEENIVDGIKSLYNALFSNK